VQDKLSSEAPARHSLLLRYLASVTASTPRLVDVSHAAVSDDGVEELLRSLASLLSAARTSVTAPGPVSIDLRGNGISDDGLQLLVAAVAVRRLHHVCALDMRANALTPDGVAAAIDAVNGANGGATASLDQDKGCIVVVCEEPVAPDAVPSVYVELSATHAASVCCDDDPRRADVVNGWLCRGEEGGSVTSEQAPVVTPPPIRTVVTIDVRHQVSSGRSESFAHSEHGDADGGTAVGTVAVDKTDAAARREARHRRSQRRRHRRDDVDGTAIASRGTV
jgi:hypothetical protein